MVGKLIINQKSFLKIIKKSWRVNMGKVIKSTIAYKKEAKTK